MLNISGFQTGKFSEELYFILMSSPMKPQLKALANKYGITDKELRQRILSSLDVIAGRSDQNEKQPALV